MPAVGGAHRRAVGTAMSTPACSRPQRCPKGETTGPLTGQISWPEPCLTGAAAGDGLELRCVTRACSASSARRSPSSCTRLSCTCAEDRPALVAHVGQLVLRRDELVLRSRDLVALGEDRVRRVLDLLLELGEQLLLLLGLRLQDADALDDRLVLLGDALEELGAVEQVGEAVGLEDHGERVGLVVLVDLDEAVRRGRPRRTTSSLRRRSSRSRASSSLPRTSSSSARFWSSVAWTRLLALEDVDVALERVDLDVVATRSSRRGRAPCTSCSRRASASLRSARRAARKARASAAASRPPGPGL